MRLRIILFLFFAWAISSCIIQTQNQLMGKWIIHEVSANGKNVKAKFLSNTIEINHNYSCSLPVMKQEERHSDKEQGEWSLVESMSGTSLTIRSSNSFFNGTYTVTLFDSAGHKGRFSKMGLRNLSTVIYCSRMSDEDRADK